MIHTKIPRKLKKRLKNSVLNRHSDYYRKRRRITTEKIRIIYIDTDRGALGFDYKLKQQ